MVPTSLLLHTCNTQGVIIKLDLHTMCHGPPIQPTLIGRAYTKFHNTIHLHNVMTNMLHNPFVERLQYTNCSSTTLPP